MTFEEWWAEWTRGAGLSNLSVLDDHDRMEGPRLFARAIWQAAMTAERERCARVAEASLSYPDDPSWPHCETGAGEAEVCDRVAARIRGGT